MPGLALIIDPEDTPLELVPDEDDSGAGFFLLSPLKIPKPSREVQWASNIDSEGEVPGGGRDKNIEIPPKLRIVGADEEDFRHRQAQFAQKLHKLGGGEGGILRLVYPDDVYIDYLVRGISGGEGLIENSFLHSWRTEEEVTFICAPYGIEEEYLAGEFTSTDRLAECVIGDVGGSAEALARAEIISTEADVWDLRWGRDSDTAPISFSPAELTPLGGAAATTATIEGKPEVSIVRQSLTPNWTAMLATGPLTQEGIYEAYAWVHMPTTNTGEVGLFLEYGVGDLAQRTELEAIYFPADHPREGKVVLVTLGQVWLRSAGRGEHRWEGRFVAKSTVLNDKLEILDVGLRPVGERSGRISATPLLNQPSVLLARDEFNQAGTEPALNGQALAAALLQSGPKNPATIVNDASQGEVAWANLNNAKTSDDAFASATTPGTAEKTSNYLKLSSFGFAIPVGATIVGISLTVEAHASFVGLGPRGADAQTIALVKGGAIEAGVGKSKTDNNRLGLSDDNRTYGGGSDMWANSWTPADVNSANFGCAVAYKMGGSQSPMSTFIDSVAVTVYYTVAGEIKWETTGDSDDIKIDDIADMAKRTAVSDADLNTGRYASVSTLFSSDVVVGTKVKRSGITAAANERLRMGALARYLDTSNWLFFGVTTAVPSAPAQEYVRVLKRVGGGEPVELGRLSIPPDYGVFRQLWLHVDRRGRFFAWGSLLESGAPRLLLVGQDKDLAEGGPLDDGKIGFYDAKEGANACTRNYDQFVAWVPALQAAAFKGRTLELTHEICRREGDNGAWAELTPEADYLRLLPAGMEGRQNRLVFLATPHDPDTMGVGFPTEVRIAVYVRRRHRGVPDPA